MSDRPAVPDCPRCDKPVRGDPHVLRLQLVNAHPGAPKESTDIKATFHHGCAAEVWTTATAAWFARQEARGDLLTEDHSEIEVVPDAARGVWEQKPSGYTADQYRADKARREARDER